MHTLAHFQECRGIGVGFRTPSLEDSLFTGADTMSEGGGGVAGGQNRDKEGLNEARKGRE